MLLIILLALVTTVSRAQQLNVGKLFLKIIYDFPFKQTKFGVIKKGIRNSRYTTNLNGPFLKDKVELD